MEVRVGEGDGKTLGFGDMTEGSKIPFHLMGPTSQRDSGAHLTGMRCIKETGGFRSQEDIKYGL